MIRELVGVLATGCALLALMFGFGETQPIPLMILVGLSGWGLS